MEELFGTVLLFTYFIIAALKLQAHMRIVYLAIGMFLPYIIAYFFEFF